MAAPAWGTSSATHSAGADITAPAPASTAQNDLLLAFLFVDQNTQTVTTVGSGYSLTAGPEQGSAGDERIWVYQKLAGASEGDTTWGLSTTNRAWSVIICRITGNDTTTPVNASATRSGTSSASQAVAQPTTTVADCLIVAFISNDQTAVTPPWYTEPSGTLTWTERLDGENANSNQAFAVATAVLASASQVPADTWTLTSADSTPHITVAVAPASSGTNAPAEVAAVTATAEQPAASIAPAPSEAAVSTVAQDPAANVQPNSEAAEVAATAESPAASIAVAPSEAAVIATAEQPTVETSGAATNAPAEVAAVTATAEQASASIAPSPTEAAVSAVALDPAASIIVNADVAPVTVVSNDATVSTAAQTNALAECATVTAAVDQPSSAVTFTASTAEVTVVTDAAASAAVVALFAAVAAVVDNAGVSLEVSPTAAEAGVGASGLDPSVSIGAAAELAVVTVGAGNITTVLPPDVRNAKASVTPNRSSAAVTANGATASSSANNSRAEVS